MNIISSSVLDTIASGAADVTLAARKLKISNDANNGTVTPEFLYPDIYGVICKPSRPETVQSYTVSWTTGGAANTQYRFTVTQQLANGEIVQSVISYTTGATTSNTDIGTNLALIVNNSKPLSAVSVHGGSNSITVSAVAGKGAPLIAIPLSGNTNVTVAANMAGVSIASSTVADPSVLTATAHGLTVGSILTITSADEAKLASGTYRVIPTNLAANTFSLASVDGQTTLAGVSGTTTATVVKVAGYAYGQGADLVAAGEKATSGALYKSYKVTYDAAVNRTEKVGASVHTLWVKEAASSTSTGYATNFATFDAELMKKFKNIVTDSGSDTATIASSAAM